MKMRMIAAMLALAAGLGGCKEGSTGPDDQFEDGTFSATMTGGFAAALSGAASSYVSQGYTVFEMYDADILGLAGGIQLYRAGGRPAVGSYAVSNNATNATAFGVVSRTGASASQNGLVFQAASGTVTITESSASIIRGSFEVSGPAVRALKPDSVFQMKAAGEFSVTQD